ncbi:hypothetical protein AACH06_25610 [Ideonella sp. DXS29W]|uniref:Holin n=1 Tax=Ideonella lacteola TaxID=2984193 RepID=A0ABU9BXQ8_9BURK
MTLDDASLTIFALFSLQLLAAFVFGRLSSPEHGVSRPAWAVAALAFVAAWFLPYLGEALYPVAGVASGIGMLHSSWQHAKAAVVQARDKP